MSGDYEIEKFEKVLERQPIVMPPEIAKAIIVVAKQVRQLGKDEENKFGNFHYVSVDKFYSVIGPMMADAGLFVIADEAECEVKPSDGKTGWLVSDWNLTIYHESGVSYGPVCRRMFVHATGPQASGSSSSYAEKYFLRGLFKIPTGEQDADGEEQNGLPEQMAKKHQSKAKAQAEEMEPAFKKMVEAAIARLKEEAKKGLKALEAEWKGGIGPKDDPQAVEIRNAVLAKMGQQWWTALKAQAEAVKANA